MQLYLSPQIAPHFLDKDPFLVLRNMEGVVYREAPGRRTVKFPLGGRNYFLKFHSGIGWKEIVKNLVQLKVPVTGAGNEWRAISRLQELGVATMHCVAFGSRGLNPAQRQSFVVTEELHDTIDLETLCKEYPQRIAEPRLRRQLIEQLARTSATLHRNGVCHRDFYLCHFLLHREPENPPRLSLIDLHRALVKNRLQRRWIVKDLAGLWYSAWEIGLSRRDLLRFIKHYSDQGLKVGLRQDDSLWKEVQARADAMFNKLGPAF